MPCNQRTPANFVFFPSLLTPVAIVCSLRRIQKRCTFTHMKLTLCVDRTLAYLRNDARQKTAAHAPAEQSLRAASLQPDSCTLGRCACAAEHNQESMSPHRNDNHTHEKGLPAPAFQPSADRKDGECVCLCVMSVCEDMGA